jgi:hypothetical protein
MWSSTARPWRARAGRLGGPAKAAMELPFAQKALPRFYVRIPGFPPPPSRCLLMALLFPSGFAVAKHRGQLGRAGLLQPSSLVRVRLAVMTVLS